MDIIGGHVSLGVLAIYDANPLLGFKARRPFHITVVREPINAFISGVRYTNKRLDRKGVVASIAQKVSTERYYSNAINYLSTMGSYDEAMKRLRDFALAGLVENFGVTMHMMARFMDPQGAYTGWTEGAH